MVCGVVVSTQNVRIESIIIIIIGISRNRTVELFEVVYALNECGWTRLAVVNAHNFLVVTTHTHTHTLKSHEVDLLSHKSHCHHRSGGHNVGAGGSRNAKKPLQLYFMNMIRDGRVIMTHRDAIYNQHKLD